MKVKCVDLGQVSIRYAAFDGKVVVTTGAQSIEEIRSGGPRLADDDAFKSARDAAGMPDETGRLRLARHRGRPAARRRARGSLGR